MTFVSAPITGTSIIGATLLPTGTRLRANVPMKHPLARRPTAITTSVKNSGATPIQKLTVLVRVGTQSRSRTITQLLRNHVRQVTVPLPAKLPTHFTIRVSALPVAGERNTSNNSAAWKLTLHP